MQLPQPLPGQITLTMVVFFLYLSLLSNVVVAGAVKDKVGETGDKIGSTVEKVHDKITSRYLDTVERIDSFYGDDRYAEKSNTSWGRLRLDTLFREGDDVDYDIKIKARVVLPQSEGRVQFLFSGDNDDDSFDPDDDDSGSFGNGGFGDEEDNPALALQYIQTQTARSSAKYAIGLHKRESKYRLNVSARHSYRWSLGEHWKGQITNRLWLFTTVGFEDDIKFEFDRLFGRNKNWLFRSFSKIRWREVEDFSTFEQRFSTYKQLSNKRALAIESLSYYQTEPDEVSGEKFESTELRVRYRQNFWRPWFFGEVQPAIGWPADRDYDETFSILFRVEFLFNASNRRLNYNLLDM